jgi:ferric-dicitrate binding protein FerR (iron transport regulator)
MEANEQIRELLQRYRNGDCTPQEAARLEQWFEQVTLSPESNGLLTEETEELLVQRLKNHPRFIIPVVVKERKVKPAYVRFIYWKAAAIWIALALTGVTAYLLYKNNSNTAAEQPLAFTIASTTAGQRQRLILPDSSVVWLNSNSRLAWHPDFTHHRELQLQGEAFFEVTHDAQHPFVVKAGKATTKVYGTAFNIAAYANTAELSVALQKGSIGITYAGGSATGEKMLSPGQRFIYAPATNAAQVVSENQAEIGGWVTGRLVFNKVPLQEVLTRLENYYGTPYKCDAALKNVLITAKFDHANPEKIRGHLAFGWDLHFNTRADTIYVQ